MIKKMQLFAIQALAIFVFFGLMVLFIYMVFFREDFEKKEIVNKTNITINQYLSAPTIENAQIALTQLKKCAKEAGITHCDFINQTELTDLLISYGHIDLVLEDAYLTELINLYFGKGAIGYRNAKLMTNYLGSHPEGLIMKADALVRIGNFEEALSIYKSLFEKGHQWQVADSLRGLLSYYGCTTDVETWGEFTNEKPSNLVRPSGSPYPAQPISADEIVDRRIRLRKGEFVAFTPECPLNKLLSGNYDDLTTTETTIPNSRLHHQ